MNLVWSSKLCIHIGKPMSISLQIQVNMVLNEVKLNMDVFLAYYPFNLRTKSHWCRRLLVLYIHLELQCLSMLSFITKLQLFLVALNKFQRT